MASTTAGATCAATRSPDDAIPVYSNPAVTWAGVRKYIGIAFIVIFCLGPFYWMVVMAFRDVGYTFDNTLYPTHVTLDNFRAAFSTQLGNHFGRALANSFFIGLCTTVIAILFGIFAAYARVRPSAR